MTRELQTCIFYFFDAFYFSDVVYLALIIEFVDYHILYQRKAEFWVGLHAQHLLTDHPVLYGASL